jgi:hypothetical protein
MTAEEERDAWQRAAESQNRQWSKKCTEVTELRAEFERVQGERDEACEELETLRALIEGEPWAGAVMRRERDKAREDLEDAREALANTIRKCPRNCTRESYCGVCEIALVALPEDYEL